MRAMMMGAVLACAGVGAAGAAVVDPDSPFNSPFVVYTNETAFAYAVGAVTRAAVDPAPNGEGGFSLSESFSLPGLYDAVGMNLNLRCIPCMYDAVGSDAAVEGEFLLGFSLGNSVTGEVWNGEASVPLGSSFLGIAGSPGGEKFDGISLSDGSLTYVFEEMTITYGTALSVTPVPLPAGGALLGLGLAGLAFAKRPRSRAGLKKMAAPLAVAAVTLAAGGASAATVSIDFEDIALGEYGTSLTVGDYVFSSAGTLSVIEGAVIEAINNTSRVLAALSGHKIAVTRTDGQVFGVGSLVSYGLKDEGTAGSSFVPSFLIRTERFGFNVGSGGGGGEGRRAGNSLSSVTSPVNIVEAGWYTVESGFGVQLGPVAVDGMVFDDAPPIPPVPLPATITLLGAALGGMALVRRARPRKRAAALGAAAAVTLMAGGASAATVVYTWTGAILEGYDSRGIFGGDPIKGHSFLWRMTVDTSAGVRQTNATSDSITYNSYVSPAVGVSPASSELTINGVTQVIPGNIDAFIGTSIREDQFLPDITNQTIGGAYPENGMPSDAALIVATYAAPLGTPVPTNIETNFFTNDLYSAPPSPGSSETVGFFSFFEYTGNNCMPGTPSVPGDFCTATPYAEGSFIFESLRVEVAAVPLPASVTLLGAALAGLGLLRRRAARHR